jgi:SAM-dependent methyltransferase
VLDVGAGTGAASRAIRAAGGRPLGVDRAFGMLVKGRRGRPPAVVGDALALPVGDGAVGGVVAAFSFNHLQAPEAGFAQAARVTIPGGPIVASIYAEDDDHPVKAAVDQAALEAGWELPAWYAEVREAAGQLARPGRLAAAAAAGGVLGEVRPLAVDFGSLPVRDLLAWRLGLAQVAPFVARLAPDRRAALERRAVELLGDPPPLVRRALVFTGVAT